MINKLLVICGPTATGKTSLALSIASKFDGEIVSADSRQVYRGLDIGTGKDLPPNAKINQSNFYLVKGTRLYGYDIVGPKDDFSVSLYLRFANETILGIQKRNKMPILVGGTGFYIKGLIDGITTSNVPKNYNLRGMLDNKTSDELFSILSTLNSVKAASMNSSDKNNPRRLIRAIEVAQYYIDHAVSRNQINRGVVHNTLFIGLFAEGDLLAERINKRVDERLKNGFEKEVDLLLKSGVNWSDRSMTSLGYRQWRRFYDGLVSRDQAILDWKNEEGKYAKRQMVWWKKDSRINWFDVDKGNYREKVEKMVKKWYS